jgi:hypothetical protein
MTQDGFSVILVYATSHAMRAEKVLAQANVPCKLIPVPRYLSSDCGVCVRVRRPDRKVAVQALEAAQIEMEGVHDV